MGAQISPIVRGGHPDFANLWREVPRFCQILIIKKTEIVQIRSYNTYMGVIKKLYVGVPRFCQSSEGGIQILPILRVGGSQILLAKIKKPPPPPLQ